MSESKADRVKLNGIEGKALSHLVDYVYTSLIEVTEENVQSLLPAANLLEVTSVLIKGRLLFYMFEVRS